MRWREMGIAYEVRESNYNQANRTMATVDAMKEVTRRLPCWNLLEKDGLTVTKWGYFSDIVLSPYIGFGIESENKKLFEKRNDVFAHVCDCRPSH